MVYKPRTEETIYESIRSGLTDRISKLTNFVPTSFNSVWVTSFTQRFRDNEVALLATQLSGWVEYAGGPVTQDQLDALGVTDVTPEEVNEFMKDEDLDNLVEIVGTQRSPGQQAEGQVTFTTVSSFTEIPEGTPVGTQPDAEGDFFEYTTDERVETPSGTTEVKNVNITAVDVGNDYNVGSGRVEYLPNPPTGVEGVVNSVAILGGTDEESNAELRDRAKQAIFDKSGGGTAAGVRGYVRSNTEDVSTVSIAEYPGGETTAPSVSPGGPAGGDGNTPYADVVVEGGDPSDIKESIEEARPVAIQHNFVRPNLVEINITAQVEGSGIDSTPIQDAVISYLNSLSLGENIYRDKIIQRILNADPQVENIVDLNIAISSEAVTFDSTQDVYTLDKGVAMEDDGITLVTGTLSNNNFTFDEPSDYEETDADGDTIDDSITWAPAGDEPDDGTDFFVTYDIIEDIEVDEYEKGDANTVSVTVV